MSARFYRVMGARDTEEPSVERPDRVGWVGIGGAAAVALLGFLLAAVGAAGWWMPLLAATIAAIAVAFLVRAAWRGVPALTVGAAVIDDSQPPARTASCTMKAATGAACLPTIEVIATDANESAGSSFHEARPP